MTSMVSAATRNSSENTGNSTDTFCMLRNCVLIIRQPERQCSSTLRCRKNCGKYLTAYNEKSRQTGNRGVYRGKSELRRAVCLVARGPARDGKCHRKHTAAINGKGEKVR